ncbi:Flotillin-like protein 1 [Rhynchospora pubera]|uniref:Flotillin-like n=1 Tax=Rhynchospora pubera TaxID=906938 RepID=A0AAV8GCC4_9POAL|nr:Flotillin-like protein 1 [Rhynchospora pubera]
MVSFRVAGPSEYLAITGTGIKEIKIAKKSWIFPGQVCICFDISPESYSFRVQAISSDNVTFVLPAVLTIGPRTDDVASLEKYARLISSQDKNSCKEHVKEIVKGVIEGETRVVASTKTLGTIFHEPKMFNNEVVEHVQKELLPFGLLIYNANVRQLVDERGIGFVSTAGIKMQQKRANQAKVEVAEETMKGDMGVKEREGHMSQYAAKVDTETKIYTKQRLGELQKEEAKVTMEVKLFENEREAEVAKANAELAMKKAEWERQTKMEQVEATKAVQLRDAELQIEVERKNAARQMEMLKAENLTKAKVEYQTKMRESEWELYNKQNAASAALYEQVQAADGCRATAEAALFESQKEAEGELYSMQNEAKALEDLAKGESEYLKSLMEKFEGDYNKVRNYMMVDKGVYEEIAAINADMMRSLQPDIRVMNQ